MDEPIKKAGQYPNVAIMAGTNPEEVKKQYEVNSSVFDEPTWEPARVERNDDERDRCQCYLFDECNRKLRLMSERSIYHAMLEWLRGDA